MESPIAAPACHRLPRSVPPWLVPALVVLLAIAAYINSFPGTFIQDDHHIVENNPLVVGLNLLEILRSGYWSDFGGDHLYRPLTILSLALNRQLFGADPLGFHLVNVGLHAGVTALFWTMLRRWGTAATAAAIAAAIFAVHPIHTEVVNQVVGRGELLAALFLLAALCAARSRRRSAPWLVCGFFICGLLSKEHAVVFLGILPLLDAFTAERWSDLRQRLPLYVALAGVTLGWLLWRQFGVLHGLPPAVVSREAVPLAYLPTGQRVLTALLLQGLYLGKLLLPLGLQAVYAPSDLPAFVTSVFTPSGVLVLLATGVLAVSLIVGWRRRSTTALFGIAYLVSFAVTANILVAIGVTFAERLTYFPSIWFAAAISLPLARCWQAQSRHRLGRLVVIVYVLLLAGLCLARNPDFASEIRYWEADVTRNGEDPLAMVCYIEELNAAGRFDEAEAGYKRLLTFAPNFAYAYRSETLFLLNQQRYDEAATAVNRAMALAREEGDLTGVGFDLGYLGRIYLAQNDYPRALSALEEGARILERPDFYAGLEAEALTGMGRYDEALTAIERGGDDPVLPTARYQLASALFGAGRLNEARALLEQLAAQESATAETWNLLGATSAQLEDWPTAVSAFERAAALAPENNFYQDNLQRARRSLAGGSPSGQ